eukprot:7806912-Pyramimonas_sp.AAC.1
MTSATVAAEGARPTRFAWGSDWRKEILIISVSQRGPKTVCLLLCGAMHAVQSTRRNTCDATSEGQYMLRK